MNDVELNEEPLEVEFEQDDTQFEPTVLDEYALVSYLTASPDVWALARPILEPRYFENEFYKVIEFCLSFSDRYKKLPSRLIIRGQTGVSLETPDDATDERILKWLCEEVEAHCRHKATIELVIKNSELVGTRRPSRGDTAEINDAWKRVSLMSMTRSIGTEVHQNMKAALVRAKANSGISCGLKHLDQILDGGFSRRSLNLFVMGSGTGKSVMLANLAYNYARIHKFNVIYITLELDEDLTQKRFASIMTDTSTTDVYQMMDTIDHQLKIRMMGPNKSEGHIFIKKMPMNGTTTADIRAYIHDLVIQTGLKFDVGIVDYLDLVSPQNQNYDKSKEHIKDKFATEELRSIMEEEDLIGFSASQRTKGSEDDSEMDSQGHVAGGTTKVNTVDNLIFGRRSDRDREEGRMWLTSKKSRTSAAHGKRFPVKFNNNTLVISDSTDEEFATALPYLTNKDISKSTARQNQFKGKAQPAQINKSSPGLDSINQYMRNRRAGLPV